MGLTKNHFAIICIFFSFQNSYALQLVTTKNFKIIRQANAKYVFSNQKDPQFFSIENQNGKFSFQKKGISTKFWIKRIRSKDSIFLSGEVTGGQIALNYFYRKKGHVYQKIEPEKCIENSPFDDLSEVLSYSEVNSSDWIKNCSMIKIDFAEKLNKLSRHISSCASLSGEDRILAELQELATEQQDGKNDLNFQLICTQDINKCGSYEEVPQENRISLKTISLSTACKTHFKGSELADDKIENTLCHEVLHMAGISDELAEHDRIANICSLNKTCESYSRLMGDTFLNPKSDVDKNDYNTQQVAANAYANMTPPPNFESAQRVANDITTLNPSTTVSRTISSDQSPAVARHFSAASAALNPAATWAYQLADYVAPVAEARPTTGSLASTSTTTRTSVAGSTSGSTKITNPDLKFKPTTTTKIDPTAAEINDPEQSSQLVATAQPPGEVSGKLTTTTAAEGGDTGGGKAGNNVGSTAKRSTASTVGGAAASAGGRTASKATPETGLPQQSQASGDSEIPPAEQLQLAGESVVRSQRLYEDLKTNPRLRDGFNSSLNKQKIIVFGPEIGTLGYHDKASAKAIYEYRTSGGKPRFVQIK